MLADALHHLVGLGATHLVDIATLTGHQRVALGAVAAAAVTNDSALLALVTEAASRRERGYGSCRHSRNTIPCSSSPIADMTNAPPRDGGAISAGLLLREFAAGRPWVHVDMAAPSWNRVPGLTEIPKGPAGWGCASLTHLAELMPATGSNLDKIDRNKPARDRGSR